MLAPRITGTEMEWGVMLQRSDEEEATLIETYQAHSFIDDYLPKDIKRTNSFLSNGSRLYVM